MNWKLWNRFFGWDYVAWENSASQGVARVCVDGDGRPYYWRYKNTRVLDRLDALSRTTSVTWLTCSSDKYMPPQSAAPADAKNQGMHK